jgi:hypothetical protein
MAGGFAVLSGRTLCRRDYSKRRDRAFYKVTKFAVRQSTKAKEKMTPGDSFRGHGLGLFNAWRDSSNRTSCAHTSDKEVDFFPQCLEPSDNAHPSLFRGFGQS